MSRRYKTLRRIEHPLAVHFITFSCQHRLPLFADDALKDRFAHQIETCRARLGFQLFAWVIMLNHIHLLLRTLHERLSVPRILEALKSPFARAVLAEWRGTSHPMLEDLTDRRGRCRFWLAGGGYDANVGREEFGRTIAYIHANPVRAGLVSTPTEWAWSSARCFAGDRSGIVRVDDWRRAFSFEPGRNDSCHG